MWGTKPLNKQFKTDRHQIQTLKRNQYTGTTAAEIDNRVYKKNPGNPVGNFTCSA